METVSRILASAGCAASMLLLSAVAQAGQTSGTLTVTTTVNGDCTVNSPTLNFGEADSTAGVNATASAVLLVTCTKGSLVSDIKLGPGSNQSPGGKRQLASGGVTVPYQLFANTFSTLWGDGSTLGIGPPVFNPFGAPSSGAGNPQAVTVYGQILAADENVPTGTYTDGVAVTVDF